MHAIHQVVGRDSSCRSRCPQIHQRIARSVESRAPRAQGNRLHRVQEPAVRVHQQGRLQMGPRERDTRSRNPKAIRGIEVKTRPKGSYSWHSDSTPTPGRVFGAFKSHHISGSADTASDLSRGRLHGKADILHMTCRTPGKARPRRPRGALAAPALRRCPCGPEFF